MIIHRFFYFICHFQWLQVALDGSYATCDFSAVLGPESTAAEVYGELSGLAQATVHGRDVAVLACGPPGAGTSYTLRLRERNTS